jgi:hypothetical protein
MRRSIYICHMEIILLHLHIEIILLHFSQGNNIATHSDGNNITPFTTITVTGILFFWEN